jgi:hypothetical protein
MTRYHRDIEQAVLADRHPLAGIPVEPWMFKRAREQAELLMQIAMNPVPNTQRKNAA